MEDAAEELVITGQLELTEADLARLAPHLPEFKRRWLPLLMFVVVTPVVVFVNHSWLTVLPMLFGGLLFGYFQLLASKKWPKRALADLGAGTTTFRFDDYGMTVSSSLREHRLAWSALSRYVEAPGGFAVYTTPRTLLVVPKRAFAAADVPRLAELLRTRVIAKPGSAPGVPFKRVALLWLTLIVAFVAIWLFLNDDVPAGDGARPSQADSAAGARP